MKIYDKRGDFAPLARSGISNIFQLNLTDNHISSVEWRLKTDLAVLLSNVVGLCGVALDVEEPDSLGLSPL